MDREPCGCLRIGHRDYLGWEVAQGDVQALLECIGIDIIVDWLEQGASIHEIARRCGCTIWSIRNFAARNAQRSARIREARVAGAEWWEHEAFRVLKQARIAVAANPLIASSLVALAREEVQACWRCAAVRDPDRYDTRRSERVAININQNGTEGQARQLATAELQRIAATASSELPEVIEAEVREIPHRRS